MPLLDTAENLLTNTALTVLAAPTPIEALGEFPPSVVDNFWKVVHAATDVVERATHDELLAKGGNAENLKKLCELLNRTLVLYRDALGRAALTEGVLKEQLHKCHVEPRLEKVLCGRYFRQIRGFMARIVEYSQHVLDAYDQHPVFVMDVNVLLDAVERFTGYLRDSAGEMDTMYLLRAIAGEVHTWYDRTNPFSEFNMLCPAAKSTAEKWSDGGRECADTQRYLSSVWSGATTAEVAQLCQWQATAWTHKKLNPKTKLPRDFAQFPEIQKDREAREIWFFINGVVTDHWIAQLNAEHLADVFKRPIHILHNPTEGLHRDIRECVSGRVLQQRIAIAEDLRRQLVKLAGTNRHAKIVIIAHSQGTILASEIVKQLRDRESDLLPRMEVFNFAFCADEFPDSCCRRLEHFVNENDFVASLSLCPGNPYNVPGRIFRRERAWGHFLGAHYLEDFKNRAYCDDRGDARSALSEYIGGANYGV